MANQVQLNVGIDPNILVEVKAYAAANRQLLRLAVEDLLLAGLSRHRPAPVKSGKRTIHKKKPKVPEGVNPLRRRLPTTEVQE